MSKKTLLIGIMLSITLNILVVSAYQYWGSPPSIVVRGRVVDENGTAVQDAKVVARLGLDLEGKEVKTWSDGTFEVTAAASEWGKGAPSITVMKSGYREYWGYFDRWLWGSRLFRVTVVLQRKQDNRPSPVAKH